MMNRGALVRAHSHWRPRRPVATSSAGTEPSRPWGGRRRSWAMAAVIAVLTAFAVTAAIQRLTNSTGLALPKTPVAWLDAFSAGVARDSGDVCSRLLSPVFRAAMERDAHESCSAYYARAQVLSIRVLRILREVSTSRSRGPLLAAGWILHVRARPSGERMGGGSDRAWRPVADRLTLAIARSPSVAPGLQRSRTRGEARCSSRRH
jgi:hypothetical protein